LIHQVAWGRLGYAETAAFGPVQLIDRMAIVSRLALWFEQFGPGGLPKLVQSRTGLDPLWTMLFWLAALPLYLVNLGGPALRDWDEGTVAQVAREIVQSSIQSPAGFVQALLHPTMWGQAYVNKPPLMHGLIAVLFQTFGESEWTARLPGAMLTALSVPLLYLVGRELFVTRRPAVFGAIAYLTLFPVVRHGRLAMLDGAILCFYCVTLLAGLRSRRDARWSLGIGVGIGLMCFTKGALGLLLGGLLLSFLAWDTPRLLRSGYLWSGLTLGLAPAIAWYGNQALGGADDFVQRGVVDQMLKRLWEPVENHQGSVFYYVGELLEWSWPWLMVLPWGLKQVWQARSLGWGKLILVLGGGYFAVISLAQTKLPWYIMPLYPVFALVVGKTLAESWDRLGGLGNQPYTPERSPKIWLGLLLLLTGVATAGGFYFWMQGQESELSLVIPLGLLAVGMALSAWRLRQHDAQWILLLAWSWYLAIGALMASSHWVFELNDGELVKPMAAVIRAAPDPALPVYTTNPIERPSLSFYSETRVIPICSLPEPFYPTEPFYLWLRDREQVAQDLGQSPIGRAEGWKLQGPLQFTQPTAEDPLRSQMAEFCN